MNPYDQALLMLLAVALLFGTAIFRGRRKRGSSRAIATFAAGCATGAVISLAFMFMYDALMPPRASIGLERIVGPIVTMFVSLIGSALLGGVVFVFEGRRPAGVGKAISVDAAAILRAAARERGTARTASHDHAQGDWRTAAKQGAADPADTV